MSLFASMSRSITVVGRGRVGEIGGKLRTICSQVVIGQLSSTMGYTCRTLKQSPSKYCA